ncbi:uncharacterized protein LOC114335457 isoform X4 [Diabrotica virgifera virgifera]|uniref:Uncharacterized protein LOC114335457 isoform X2 n=1 Tax=Diabrotica virgifera virgifera TaxID=50390 RepID=A0A6P7FY44_DIAVI|nr:uncharacterized protein LOC114335457 isoform X4 [Diabrotica virgifera virgifera]
MILPYNFTADEVISVGRTSRTNVEAVKSSLKICNESYVPKELPDELIVEFLLACENDVEFAKTTISVHYRLKKEEPLLFDNYSGINPEIKELFDIWSISTLPTRTKENYSIHYFRLESSDLKKFNSITVLRSALMVVDITLNNNPPDGFIVIVDLNLASLNRKSYFACMEEQNNCTHRMDHATQSYEIIMKAEELASNIEQNQIMTALGTEIALQKEVSSFERLVIATRSVTMTDTVCRFDHHTPVFGCTFGWFNHAQPYDNHTIHCEPTHF